MTQLSKDHFIALWSVLLDNYKQVRNDFTTAFIYQTLMEQDPELTADQFSYAVQQCLINCKFMPTLNEVFRQLYEPDLRGGPVMPDIDPRYADDYLRSQFFKAQALRCKWEAENEHKPRIGVFREDRIKQIPDIPERARLQGSYSRPENDLLGLGGQQEVPSLSTAHDREMQLQERKRALIAEVKNAY